MAQALFADMELFMISDEPGKIKLGVETSPASALRLLRFLQDTPGVTGWHHTLDQMIKELVEGMETDFQDIPGNG